MLSSSLAESHLRNVYHRDIKLNNILVECVKGKCSVCLIDFGFATNTRHGQEYLNCGTPLFMPPEIHSKKGYNAWAADV